MGVEAVVLLRAEAHVSGDVGAGLVGVEAEGGPPAIDGGGLGSDGRDGAEEGADYPLLGWLPRAVPERMDGYVGGEDGAHVVAEVHEFG